MSSPVIRAQEEMATPARRPELWRGWEFMPSERERTTKPPAMNIWRKKSSMVLRIG